MTDALLADTIRIDWLDTKTVYGSQRKSGGGVTTHEIFVSFKFPFEGTGNLSTAIDLAMYQEKQNDANQSEIEDQKHSLNIEGAGIVPDGLMENKKRALFEKHYSENGKWPKAVERSGDNYKLMQTHAAWTTWQAAFEAMKESENDDPTARRHG